MLSRIRSRITYANLIATGALFLALGGGALAATSFVGSGGQIRGCVSKGGQLTLVQPGKSCKKGLSAITWGQKGPKGDPGAKGDSGTPGSPGTPGTNGANGTNGNNGTNGTNGATNVVVRSGTGNVHCNTGEVATGGGGAPNSPGLSLFSSIPETCNGSTY